MGVAKAITVSISILSFRSAVMKMNVNIIQHQMLTGHSAMLYGRIPPAPVAETHNPMTMVIMYNQTL